MTLTVRVRGRRYVENRDTAEVMSGSKDREITFTERWTMALDGSDETPWRLVASPDTAPVAALDNPGQERVPHGVTDLFRPALRSGNRWTSRRSERDEMANSGEEERVQSGAATADPSSTPDIRLIDLEKRFGDFAAVDHIELDVAPGEFFTMLGPSGSGKTTTLRLIAGFELPDSGRVELARRGRRAAPAVRARRQHRLPGLRALPAHDRARQRRLRPEDPQGRPP